MIKEILKKDLFDDILKYETILLGLSIKNSKGRGFLYRINLAFPEVLKEIMSSNYDDYKKLGTCTVVPTDDGNPDFILCYITKGRRRPDKQPDALDYDALKECLETINANYKGKVVASTIMGHHPFEAGGDKDKILKMFDEFAPDVIFYLYDYEQLDAFYVFHKKAIEILTKYENHEITREEKLNLSKINLWQEYFGELSYPPKEISYRELANRIRRGEKRHDICKDYPET